MAAGTKPPRATAIMPFHGPSAMRRQASALALRCNSSQVTGNVFCALTVMAHSPRTYPGGPCVARPRGQGNLQRERSGGVLWKLGDDAAIDFPASVRLPLHQIEGEHAFAVGTVDLDRLHGHAIVNRNIAEAHLLGAVDRKIARAHHVQELLRGAELGPDRR